MEKVNTNEWATDTTKVVLVGEAMSIPLHDTIKGLLKLEVEERVDGIYDPIVEIKVRHTGGFKKRLSRKKKDISFSKSEDEEI